MYDIIVKLCSTKFLHFPIRSFSPSFQPTLATHSFRSRILQYIHGTFKLSLKLSLKPNFPLPKPFPLFGFLVWQHFTSRYKTLYYLLLCNKLPPMQQLETPPFIISDFRGLNTSVWLRWCLWLKISEGHMKLFVRVVASSGGSPEGGSNCKLTYVVVVKVQFLAGC